MARAAALIVTMEGPATWTVPEERGMSGQTLKIITSPNAQERVLIVCRADGAYTYRRQRVSSAEWIAVGPDCDIYDSPETAEAEAHCRVSWLASISN